MKPPERVRRIEIKARLKRRAFCFVLRRFPVLAPLPFSLHQTTRSNSLRQHQRPQVNPLLTLTAQHLALRRVAKRRYSSFIQGLAGAPRSNAMSLPDVRPQANLPQANLLSDFALATLSAFDLGLPIAAAIFWLSSYSLSRFPLSAT